MRYIIFIIFLFLNHILNGQTGVIPQSLKTLMDVPALEVGARSNMTRKPSIIRFDKLVIIKGSANSGREFYTYLYINTKNGDIGICTKDGTVVEDGNLNIDDPDFRLMYYTKQGLIYNFYNRKKDGGIRKYMSSLNTEVVPFSGVLPSQNTLMFRQGMVGNVLPQGFEAAAYKAGGSDAATFVVCGGEKHEKMVFKEFLGYSGIGYVKTDYGIYMTVKLKSENNGFEAIKWKDEDYKLNVSDFTHFESELYPELLERNQNQIEKLEQKEFTGDCASLETQIRDMKVEVKKKEQGYINDAKKGNPMDDANVRTALINLYGDPIEQLNISLLEQDLRLCKLEQVRIKTETEANLKEKILKQKEKIIKGIEKLKVLKERYPNPNDQLILRQEQYKVLMESNRED